MSLIICPECDVEAEHQLLNEAQNLTLQCIECHNVFTTPNKRQRRRKLHLNISEDGRAVRQEFEMGMEEDVAVGDEFDFDGHRLLVTGMENAAGQWVKKAQGHELKTLHAKIFDYVWLNLSMNENDITRSFRTQVEPEFEVHIGDRITVDEVRMIVKTLKSDMNRTINRGFLYSRNIVRAFCDPAPTRKERYALRRRGAPPGAKRVPRRGPKR